jgi:hypothetical protein
MLLLSCFGCQTCICVQAGVDPSQQGAVRKTITLRGALHLLSLCGGTLWLTC